MQELHLVLGENAYSLSLQIFQSYRLGIRTRGQLDVESNHDFTFSWNNQQIAGSRSYAGFLPNVWEVGSWENVHNTPYCVTGISNHLVAQ
jgi:hypothetical protein